MGYIIADDFKGAIQKDNLTQVIGGDASILDDAIAQASTTAREYLKEKFDIDSELQDTTAYDNTLAYKPGQRVYLDAPAYSASSTYNIGDLTLQAGNIYRCSTAIAVGEPFNAGHWTLLGLQYQIFYVPLPKPLFQVNNIYKTGDQVYWNGNVYTCVIATVIIAHEVVLQFQTYAAVPPRNIFPDDPTNGEAYWGLGVDASVAPGSLPTGWTKGDNRNMSLVRHCVAIALWFVHFRISPRNVPEVRDIAYRGRVDDRVATRDGIIYPDYCALGWLQSVSKGNLSPADLLFKQPAQGSYFRWGSQVKRQNNY